MNYPTKRYPEHVKHDAVRRWQAASGKGSAVKRHAILQEIGCVAESIYKWRKDGYGQPLRPMDQQQKVSVVSDDDVLDWLIDAGRDLGLDEAMADRLLGHRVRWAKARAK